MVTSIRARLGNTYGPSLSSHFAGWEWEELFLTVEIFGEEVLYREEEDVYGD